MYMIVMELNILFMKQTICYACSYLYLFDMLLRQFPYSNGVVKVVLHGLYTVMNNLWRLLKGMGCTRTPN